MLFGLLIPLAFIGSELYGLIGIFIAIPVANILSGIGARLILNKVLGSIFNELSEKAIQNKN
jgi:hypothetical protein